MEKIIAIYSHGTLEEGRTKMYFRMVRGESMFAVESSVISPYRSVVVLLAFLCIML